MAQQSPIEWTDHTFNPWWGCFKISEGCAHCYADTLASRYKYNVWGPASTTDRRIFGDQHWADPIKWNRQAQDKGKRARVFCASMADVFEVHDTAERQRPRLWELINQTPALDWLLLTKRPQNMNSMTPWDKWPSNVWAMTSVENQIQAQLRIPQLLEVPAVIRALSVEPLLGPVDLSPWIKDLDWVIVGGESGSHARPMDIQWVRAIRDLCVDAGVAFFFKQWGMWSPNPNDETDMIRASKKASGRTLDNLLWDEVPTSPLVLLPN